MSRTMSGIVESASGGNEEEKNRQQANRSRLVSRLLAASPDLPAFLNDLITTQAVVVAGTEAVAFVIKRGEQAGFMLEPVAHVRPDGADEEVRAQAINAFKELVFPCVQQNKDGAIELAAATGNDEGQYCLVTILRNEANSVAVSAVITRCRDVERAQQRLVSMQLVAGYFDLFNLRRKSEQALSLAGNHQDVLQYATAVGTAENFANSAANLCNALAARTGSVRVSLGWFKGNSIKVKALSHTENFDKRQELITDLQRVMEEAADQDEPVYFNPTPEIGEPSTQNVTREASAFSRKQGGNSVLAVPLRKAGEVVGVLTLEWAPKVALPSGAVNAMTVAADVLSPQLEDRYQNDRWLITKTGLSVKWLGEKIVGPQYMIAKLVCLLILGGLLFACFYTPMYHVKSTFQFATVEKRILPAPYEGFIESVPKGIKAGVKVRKGDVLAVLDSSELKKQFIKASSDAAAASVEASNYRRDGKSSESHQAAMRARASQAEADLYQARIEQATIRAPIDGYIMKCEVEDRLGGQVKLGENLFEISQIDNLKVELLVREDDIQRVKVGQKGYVATTSQPGDEYAITIDRVVPQGEPKEGANVFRVYGVLESPIKEGWRPGIQGEARVAVEERSLAYRFTHKAVDWVRLKIWRFI